MLSPSDILIRPTSLNERLAAEKLGRAASPSRADHHGGALRSRGEEAATEGPDPARYRAPGDAEAHAGSRPATSSAGRWLLVASLLVSLVPTALILALLWQGAIKLPLPNSQPPSSQIKAADLDQPKAADQNQLAETEHASVAAAPVLAVAPPSPKSEIVLTTPARTRGEDRRRA